MSLVTRLSYIQSLQNADGGWGYFAGKQSWLEPTAYACLALHGVSGSEPALQKARKFIQTLRQPDGSYHPSLAVKESTWITALPVLLDSTDRALPAKSSTQSVRWLIEAHGEETRLFAKLVDSLTRSVAPLDLKHNGWPWRPGNSSWVEPTCYTLTALKRTAHFGEPVYLRHRIAEAEIMLLKRRCKDGGWNSGTPLVYDYELPSYPETTALALIALQGRDQRDFPGALDIAERMLAETKSTLAKAWLGIALRLYGRPPAPAPSFEEGKPIPADIMIASLETLAHPDGNFRLLARSGAAA